MIDERHIGRVRILLAAMYVVVLFTSIIIGAGQSSVTKNADRAYCVGSGYLYATSPSLNNGQEICQFPNEDWCDAHAFATGKCMYIPFEYNVWGVGYYDISTPAEASYVCQNSGGKIETVHTPYGDRALCIFPNGRSMDLYGLYRGYWGSGLYSGDYWYL